MNHLDQNTLLKPSNIKNAKDDAAMRRAAWYIQFGSSWGGSCCMRRGHLVCKDGPVVDAAPPLPDEAEADEDTNALSDRPIIIFDMVDTMRPHVGH